MNGQVIATIDELRDYTACSRRTQQTIGFVPTMGALHEGHLTLIRRARRENDILVVSVFVNPIQFNQKDDYQLYPRPIEGDVEHCRQNRVDVVFMPSIEEMYPAPLSTFVEVNTVGERLCGEHRPGHFRGVATVVMKLFQIVQPKRAYFGEKDAQQLAVIQRMVRDLNVPVEIVAVNTVREADGLAMSSRNQHLNEKERKAAPALYRALQMVHEWIRSGEHNVEKMKQDARAALASEPLIKLEYLEIVDPFDMQPVESIEGPVRIALAAWIGKTRLIDNVLAEVSARSIPPR